MGIVFTGVRETRVAKRATVIAVKMANRGFITWFQALEPFVEKWVKEVPSQGV